MVPPSLLSRTPPAAISSSFFSLPQAHQLVCMIVPSRLDLQGFFTQPGSKTAVCLLLTELRCSGQVPGSTTQHQRVRNVCLCCCYCVCVINPARVCRRVKLGHADVQSRALGSRLVEDVFLWRECTLSAFMNASS